MLSMTMIPLMTDLPPSIICRRPPYPVPSRPWLHPLWLKIIRVGSNAVSAHLCLPSQTIWYSVTQLNRVSKNLRTTTKKVFPGPNKLTPSFIFWNWLFTTYCEQLSDHLMVNYSTSPMEYGYISIELKQNSVKSFGHWSVMRRNKSERLIWF